MQKDGYIPLYSSEDEQTPDIPSKVRRAASSLISCRKMVSNCFDCAVQMSHGTFDRGDGLANGTRSSIYQSSPDNRPRNIDHSWRTASRLSVPESNNSEAEDVESIGSSSTHTIVPASLETLLPPNDSRWIHRDSVKAAVSSTDLSRDLGDSNIWIRGGGDEAFDCNLND